MMPGIIKRRSEFPKDLLPKNILITRRSLMMLCLVLPLLAAPLTAQDTLHLPVLQEAAIERNPRARQLALQEEATELRLRNIAAKRLPSLTIGAEGTHQSEVPSILINQSGVGVSQPPKDRYQVTLDAEQLLYDGGVLDRRRAVEVAKLRAQLAQIAAELYPLRTEVNEAFFGAFLLQERLAEIATLIEDLEARLSLLRAQVQEGAALPGDTAMVQAEMLRAIQNRGETAADHRAAIALLAELTNRPITEHDVLELPEFAAEAARRQTAAELSRSAALREHPQYAVFEAQREQLERRQALLQAQTQPQIFAFGQVGYGRPGLQQFTDEFHDYGLAGVRLRWQPWNWGATEREREILEIQQQIIDTEEAAFADRLRRLVHNELVAIERLQETLAVDEEIIALREQIARTARVQLAERAITPAEYVDIRTDLQEARLARQRHRVELAQARAQYLTTLGIAPR